jgi:hypothetical protein
VKRFRAAGLGVALAVMVMAGMLSASAARREKKGMAQPATAQAPAAEAPAANPPAANPKDVESLDAIVVAIYNVISGPPGPRDWNRFNSLFAPDAKLIAVRVPKDGGKPTLFVMTPKGYEERAGKFFLEKGFFESEVSRKTDSFGHMTHIYTTYESRETKDAKPFARGINSMEFFNDGQRWWCVQIYWDEERADNPIPEKYLKK